MPEDIEMLDFEAFRKRYENVLVEEYPNNVREVVPEPVVSVHLLTYNHVDYIEEAIESVLMQEVDFPMEIVLGDDDSSDGTREICIEYAKQYPDLIRLQLHHRENNIPLHERPTHLFQYWYNTLGARGKYIAVLSGDDYWTDSSKLQKQFDFLKENPGYALSFHDATIVNSKKDISGGLKSPEKNRKDFSKIQLMRGPYLPALSLFYINIFDSVPSNLIFCLNEDKVVISLLGQKGKAKFQDEIEPAVYRLHKKGIWSQADKYDRFYHHSRTTNELFRYYRAKQLDVIALYYLSKYKSYSNKLLKINIEDGDLVEYLKNLFKVLVFLLRQKDLRSAVGFVLNFGRIVARKYRSKLIQTSPR